MSEIPEDKLERQVRSIIVDVFKLSPDEATGDLQIGKPPQWDSIGHMQLLVRIEDEFGLRFPMHAIPNLINVPAILEAIQAQQ